MKFVAFLFVTILCFGKSKALLNSYDTIALRQNRGPVLGIPGFKQTFSSSAESSEANEDEVQIPSALVVKVGPTKTKMIIPLPCKTVTCRNFLLGLAYMRQGKATESQNVEDTQLFGEGYQRRNQIFKDYQKQDDGTRRQKPIYKMLHLRNLLRG